MPAAQTIRCDSCGAPLQIPPTARFVTCQHCSAELEVQRNADVAFTKILQKLAERLQETQSQLDQLKRQQEPQELDQLDSEWEQKRRDSYATLYPDDPEEMPDFSKHGRWWMLAIIADIVFLIAGVVHGNSDLVILMVLGLLAFPFLLGMDLSRFNRYHQDLIAYRSRRLKLQTLESAEDEYEEGDDS